MPYNQYGQWVDDSGYSPMPGAGMGSVISGNSNADRTFGDGWSGGGGNTAQAIQAIQAVRGGAGRAPAAPFDSVYTGHATERVPEDPRVLGMVPGLMQYGGGNVNPAWGRYGDTLRINGREQQIPAGAGDDWISQQVKGAQSAPMDIAQRSSALLDHLYKQPGMDALTASQIHTRVLGVDPMSLQKQQSEQSERQMKLAAELSREGTAKQKQQMELQKQHAAMADDFAKQYGANGWGEMYESYNKDPAYPNQFFSPGGQKTLADGTIVDLPSRRLGVDPTAFNAFRQHVSLGYLGGGQSATPDRRAELASVERAIQMEEARRSGFAPQEQAPNEMGAMRLRDEQRLPGSLQAAARYIEMQRRLNQPPVQTLGGFDWPSSY